MGRCTYLRNWENIFTNIIEQRYVIHIVSSQIRLRRIAYFLWLLFSNQSHNSEKLEVENE